MDKKTLQLDDVDHKIISILSANSRMSSREVAKEVSVSHQTVLSRVKMLEKHGVIGQYGAFIDWTKMGYPLKTMTLVEAGNLDPEKFKMVIEYIKNEPSFVSASHLDGTYDMYIVGVFKNQQESKKKLSDLRSYLSGLIDVRSFKNHSIWETIKHTHKVR